MPGQAAQCPTRGWLAMLSEVQAAPRYPRCKGGAAFLGGQAADGNGKINPPQESNPSAGTSSPSSRSGPAAVAADAESRLLNKSLQKIKAPGLQQWFLQDEE